MRAFAVLVLSLTLGGCARLTGGGSGREVMQSLPLTVDSTLRVATTQLTHHGFTVTQLGENAVITSPRPVPEWLAERDGTFKGRQWVVQVSAESHFLARGSRFEVAGFLLPEGTTRPAPGTAPLVQNAIPITDQHRLFQELRTIAGWIGDAGQRKR
jgi:hypothetical protein